MSIDEAVFLLGCLVAVVGFAVWDAVTGDYLGMGINAVLAGLVVVTGQARGRRKSKP